MPQISGKLKVSISKRLDRKVSDAVQKQLDRKVERIRDKVEERARTFVVAAIESSEVYRAILGEFSGDETGLDLAAEFGLSPGRAKKAMSSLTRIISNQIEVKIRRPKTPTAAITVTVEGVDREDYYDRLSGGHEFYYTSSKSGIEIPWMSIILNPFDTIEEWIDDIGGHGIVYGPHKPGRSRSGRAIMVATSNFPYVMPRAVLPDRGRDFIEDALQRGGKLSFKIAINKELRKALRSEIR